MASHPERPAGDALRAAFDPETFRTLGHRLVDRLAEYLAQAETRELPVLPWTAPDEMLGRWQGEFPVEPAAPETLVEQLGRLIGDSHHLHHPRYTGHQVSVPLPTAALCDFVVALLNNGTAIYEMGPVGAVMERQLVHWMSRALGLGETADGIFTSGGSAGNLTALLGARQARAGFDIWSEGAHGGRPLALLVSEQAHYSIARAVQIMGWGQGGAVPVPVDAQYRLRPEALPVALAAAERDGRRVVAVVGSACSTSTGAFDPLEPIADFCAAHGLWFHVDGAHGASAALSPRYRELLRGIERADSVVWDAHKMMLVPSLATAVLFREGRHSYQTFAQEAAYLYARDQPPEWFNLGVRTLECTKDVMVAKLYLSLLVHGTRLFADHIDATFDLARRFARRISETPGFELATSPEANIVCFRHAPADLAPAERDALQTRIRRRLVESGRFYLVQTRLRDGIYLRTTLINSLTSDADLVALLDAVREAAR